MEMIRSRLRSLLSSAPPSLLYEVFYQSARALGVTAYEVEGKVGRFAGTLRDQAVIKPYLLNGAWSPELVRILSQALKDGGTFIDVGANIGLVTVPIARLDGVDVVAIEPDPENCALLRANIARNEVGDRVRVIGAAAADKPGRMGFVRSAYNSGDHRLAPDATDTVPVLPLDQIVPFGTSKLVIKIDTQGAEPLVIAGGAESLERAELIVMEFWPWGMRRMGLEPASVLAWVKRLGRDGALLKQDQAMPAASPVKTLLQTMERMVQTGGEHDYGDLVITKRSLGADMTTNRSDTATAVAATAGPSA